MDNDDYKLIKASLLQSDRALEIFKMDLSPTSLRSLARHIARHTLSMLAAEPKPIDLVAVIMGLMLKLACDKEVQVFLKAEEAADAAQD